MAFPTSPTNGQQVIVNGITYTYASAAQSWTRAQGVAGNIAATGNISANNYTVTGTGIFWGNGSPAVYNTSFWVQDQDFGFTANTADYGNVLGLVTESVDDSYDTGTVLNGSAIDGNNIVVSTVTGDKFVNNIAIASATLTEPVSIKAMYETSTITASAPTSTTNFDVITQATQFFTSNATTDFTFNIRGNSTTTLNSVLAIGQTVTLTALITVGATGYIPTTVQVDSSNVSVNWLNGASPSSSYTSCKVSYTFTVIKTAAATFTVLGSQTRYG